MKRDGEVPIENELATITNDFGECLGISVVLVGRNESGPERVVEMARDEGEDHIANMKGRWKCRARAKVVSQTHVETCPLKRIMVREGGKEYEGNARTKEIKKEGEGLVMPSIICTENYLVEVVQQPC